MTDSNGTKTESRSLVDQHRNGQLCTLLHSFLTTVLLAFTTAVSVHATIISGVVTGGTAFTAGGHFVKLTVPLANPFGPPNSVGNDNFQSPNLFGFDESQNILITTALTADVGGPIPIGSTVASHYIFFDPGPTENIIGTVNFDSDVLAIFTSTGRLISTDFLSHTGVNYLSPAARGLEPGDSVTISGPRQILFNTTASSPGDYVRVLTTSSPAAAAAGVPEPGAMATLGSGLAVLAVLLPYRRKRTGKPAKLL
ncbi:MAG TPA: hypothetical protein VNY05_44095 [Candidatus Acidoferrales bacterium]|jgi:hypothetical protein|nr:hypothetical protein [Candidatus Acidoferrales bacterium]